MIPINNDMRFEITTKCNYNCLICPRDKLKRKIETMSLEVFEMLLDKILKETTQFNTLTFPGLGEPLLDETLDKKIEYARQKNLNVLILTNGFFLSVERFKKLEDLGVESVRVSFYGNNPEEYARAHGLNDKCVFEIVRDNLNAIAKIKKYTKLLLTLNVLEVYSDGYENEWIKYWNDKADLIEVWRPHNWVNGRNYRTVQSDRLRSCGRPLKGPLQIQVDGTVNMCCFDFNGELTLGDLKTQTLREVFSSPLYKKIIKCHKTGDFKDNKLICSNCDQRNMDKSEIMIYNSKFDITERINTLSTTYKKFF